MEHTILIEIRNGYDLEVNVYCNILLMLYDFEDVTIRTVPRTTVTINSPAPINALYPNDKLIIIINHVM